MDKKKELQHLKNSQKHRSSDEKSYLAMKTYKGNNLYMIVDLNTQYWMEDKSMGISNLLVLIS